MKEDKELLSKIDEFNRKNKIFISYGGDGTLLSSIHKTNFKRPIIPFRNYGLCEKHSSRLVDFLNKTYTSENKLGLKGTRHSLIQYFYNNKNIQAAGISEIVIKNADISTALRYNIFIDDKLYLKNVISDGCIFSTRFGSTGYWKSVSRCIFNCDAIGIGFIAPTAGINNLIVSSTSRIKIEIIRDAKVFIGNDNNVNTYFFNKNDIIEIQMIPDAIMIFGLDIFQCQDCRLNRHAIIENGIPIEDKYSII